MSGLKDGKAECGATLNVYGLPLQAYTEGGSVPCDDGEDYHRDIGDLECSGRSACLHHKPPEKAAKKTKPKKAEPQKKPWETEGDYRMFYFGSFPCVMIRSDLGHWCGYVGLPEGHPWIPPEGGMNGEPLYYVNGPIEVHGGITYGGADRPMIPEGKTEPGYAAWWLGFDCAHSWDYVPGMPGSGKPSSYKDEAYVTNECTKLAQQASWSKLWTEKGEAAKLAAAKKAAEKAKQNPAFVIETIEVKNGTVTVTGVMNATAGRKWPPPVSDEPGLSPGQWPVIGRSRRRE